MKIFLVDNELAVRERMCAMIEEIEGVIIVGHAAEAGNLEFRLQECKPDVVILDIHVPGGGLDLIRRIQTASGRPVVITMVDSPSLLYRIKCHQAGATYFFDKRNEQDHLLEALRNLEKEFA
jgi:DNA-binding NarL/FixJ family response regulator